MLKNFFLFVYQAKSIAKAVGLPALPITANFLPLPSPIDIHIGKPISIPKELSQDSGDHEINQEVKKVELIIEEMIKKGLKTRRPFFANKPGPAND